MTEENATPKSAEQRLKLRRRVTQLIEGAAPRRLNPIRRLKAAAHIGGLVRVIRDGGKSMTEICEDLGKAMQSKRDSTSEEPFRLHRWMLKGGAADYHDSLNVKYEGKPEPLRTTHTYLRLIDALAPMAGIDPLDSQGALLSALGIVDGGRFTEDDDILPEQRVADLLNEHAAVVARELDLAKLFQRAARVQLGWNIQRGPSAVADLARTNTGTFRSDEPVDREYWVEVAAPPLPSVAIARIPFGLLPGPIFLTDEGGETQEHRGHAVAYWDLHIAIGPTGPLAVGAFLIRGTSVDIVIDHQVIRLSDVQDDVGQIVKGGPFVPAVVFADRTWSVSTRMSAVYRPERPGQDESPPSMGVPNIRIDPVSSGSLRAWLMKPMDYLPEGGPWLSSQDLLAGHVTQDIGWIRGECFAQSLEMALRDGFLDARFREWVDTFRPKLDQFEQEWINRTLEIDAALRERAIADDLAEETA